MSNKVRLRKSETGEVIAEFDTLKEAMDYADDHDLHGVYIDGSDIVPELKPQ